MTRTVTALCLLLIFTLPVRAVDDGKVMYVGGTIANLKDRAVGKFRREVADRTEI